MLCKRFSLVLLTTARASSDLPKILLRSDITFFGKSFSSKRRTAGEQSFTVSYLISSCGLSPETALLASQKNIHFQSADQPDLVLTLLRNHGFTDTHLSKLFRLRPKLLLYDPQKTLLPKLEFFQSIGIPKGDLAKIISSNPCLLESSLKNQLIPVYTFLKDAILLDDKQVTRVLKYCSWVFKTRLEGEIAPKIALLRELGVSVSRISLLVTYHPFVLLPKCDKFEKFVEELLDMGFNPSKSFFIYALAIMIRTSKPTWQHKIEVYRKCGWSEDDTQLAFKKQPNCMGLSEEKIIRVMDLLVNKMGWKPTAIAKVPTVLCYSLEKRTFPRCLVVKVLILKGLIEKYVCFSSTLIMSDKSFLDKYVTRYSKDVPLLLDIFTGKEAIAELGLKLMNSGRGNCCSINAIDG